MSKNRSQVNFAWFVTIIHDHPEPEGHIAFPSNQTPKRGDEITLPSDGSKAVISSVNEHTLEITALQGYALEKSDLSYHLLTGDDKDNQYHPWTDEDCPADTEVDYWKMRYRESRQEAHRLAEAVMDMTDISGDTSYVDIFHRLAIAVDLARDIEGKGKQ